MDQERHIAQNWRINAQRYALKGSRCEECQVVAFPPRQVCTSCGHANPLRESMKHISRNGAHSPDTDTTSSSSK